MSLNQIKAAVAELPEAARGSLAAWLLESLPPHADEDAAAAGIEEAARRRDDLESGKVQAMDADEFWTAVKQERASWK
jgi:Putative addiction module component